MVLGRKIATVPGKKLSIQDIFDKCKIAAEKKGKRKWFSDVNGSRLDALVLESRVLGDNSTQLLLMTKIQTGSMKVVYYHLTSA